MAPAAAFAQDQAAPAAPVAIARCRSYETAEVISSLDHLFDQLGGLGRIVAGKTVAIKINLTGSPTYRVGHSPAGDTHWTHPSVIGAAVHLMGHAGARRVRLLESPWSTAEPLEEYMLAAGWEPRDLLGAAARVECENTNWLGNAKSYSRFTPPNGGHLFRAYDLNHSYADCDVFVSIAKMKEHGTTGVTLSMKNCFGITPCTIYGAGAGVDEPSVLPRGGRGLIHDGRRQPSKSAPSENDPSSPRDGGYRVPRAVADLIAARPIHLAIVDGIVTMTGGEGPWVGRPQQVVAPGVLFAGTNCVTTDAVGTALMGFDPMADRGVSPFEKCDSTLALAERHGVGTRDLKRIEVLGMQIAEARMDFRKVAARQSRA